jgi:hypothetical protein
MDFGGISRHKGQSIQKHEGTAAGIQRKASAASYAQLTSQAIHPGNTVQGILGGQAVEGLGILPGQQAQACGGAFRALNHTGGCDHYRLQNFKVGIPDGIPCGQIDLRWEGLSLPLQTNGICHQGDEEKPKGMSNQRKQSRTWKSEFSHKRHE